MDRVVYFFEDGTKRVEKVTEQAWLEEIQSELTCMKRKKTVESAVAEFNTTLKELDSACRVVFLRVVK